jgi:hypothetical protein
MGSDPLGERTGRAWLDEAPSHPRAGLRDPQSGGSHHRSPQRKGFISRAAPRGRTRAEQEARRTTDSGSTMRGVGRTEPARGSCLEARARPAEDHQPVRRPSPGGRAPRSEPRTPLRRQPACRDDEREVFVRAG